jgi:hypothetical protein
MGVLSVVLGPILDFIGKPIQKYQEERAEKLAQKRVVVEAKAQRQAQEQVNVRAWEENVLTKSGVYLRWVCALHLFAGMDYTIYACMVGKDAHALWDALATMPDWYAGLLATMFGFAFGSAPLKSVGGKLFQGWQNRAAQRKLDPSTAVNSSVPNSYNPKYGNTDK